MQRCITGKVRHSSPRRAKVAAHSFARALNADGKLAQTMYAYRCTKCRGGWHLTRQAGWDGNVLAFEAPSEALQRWAMPSTNHNEQEQR